MEMSKKPAKLLLTDAKFHPSFGTKRWRNVIRAARENLYLESGQYIEEMLELEDVVNMLRISEQEVEVLEQLGELTPIKLGCGCVRYCKAELEQIQIERENKKTGQEGAKPLPGRKV